ncbi:SDR family oxidoreductase [Halomarina oriensis]|uniref:SDR family oxidoreductase n=1 Tax=Halomarina oriensis TaxID=671145 RepID=A0A6B0GI88_9EURY|nr:SDR family oxidoreductase [Halomarina oriensis]MWG34582.1 SDR family oxidoreductase [Halomarina oriensis]
MDLGLAGDAALVTAGTSGLGRASAEALAREGAHVAVCGRTRAHIDDTRDSLESLGDGDVLAVEADITDRERVEGFVTDTVDAFGGLDHVVTSAGGPPSGAFLDTDDEDWYDAYDLLVMSVVWTARTAHPHLEDGGGTITAITSRSVEHAIDGLVLSNSVRRGVIGLVETLSTEFAPDVRTNAVLPGTHETSRIEDLIEQGIERGEYDDYDAAREEWGAGIPLERIGRPEELGDVVAFLASDRASFLNGVSVPIDGGQT